MSEVSYVFLKEKYNFFYMYNILMTKYPLALIFPLDCILLSFFIILPNKNILNFTRCANPISMQRQQVNVIQIKVYFKSQTNHLHPFHFSEHLFVVTCECGGMATNTYSNKLIAIPYI